VATQQGHQQAGPSTFMPFFPCLPPSPCILDLLGGMSGGTWERLFAGHFASEDSCGEVRM
jgi:hypothetical protein